MENYTKTDQYIHWLSQVIAKANRSFVPAKADDSHTNLYFDWMGDRIVGKWVEAETGKIMLTLNLSNLQFEWLNAAYKPVASFKTIGKTVNEVEQDIANHLPEFGLNKNGFIDKLHYEIPNYPFTVLAIKAIDKNHLDEWRYFRNLANKVCTVLLGYLQIEGEIRIWPHHFDTGIYVVTNDGIGIGFGLAMSDSMVGGPYFYMSGYPSTGSLEYEKLPNFLGGKWITSDHWNGAVLPLSELRNRPKKEYKTIINGYLLKAVNWYTNRN